MAEWKCCECGHVFDEPYEYDEPDVGYHALWCPSCHSDDIVEVRECKLCDELTPIHLLTIDGYCPACVKRTARKLDFFLKKCESEELQIFEHEFGIEPISY